MRKIVQLVAVEARQYSRGFVMALCEDNTVWEWWANEWVKLPEIPSE